MEGFLGETLLEPFAGTEYEHFTPQDWALFYIGRYGSFAGGHHRKWVLDQVARILLGTRVLVKVARWANGHEEHRYDLDEPTKEYWEWVADQRGELDPKTGSYEYDYDFGTPP